MTDIRIPPDLDGVRADKAIASLAKVSRSVSRRWCEQGEALVDGAPVPPSASVSEGQLLTHPEPAAKPVLQPDPTVPFDVVHEDHHIAVVVKPPGVVVHPGAGRTGPTLAAGLLARWPGIAGVGQPGRWGLVHRLDRETSGLLAIALTGEAYTGLSEAMAKRTVTRVYLAGVEGTMTAETGTIDAPIRRDPQRPTRMAVHRAGRPARTHYRRVGTLIPTGDLLEVTLETGRTHQIRVHLSRIGHPVVGDRLYGWRGSGWEGRIWLHAHRLSFEHPVTGDQIDEVSELPPELAETCSRT